MREANKAIKKTSYPSPSLEDLINILEGSKIYCKLDINNAFLQFELDSALREITTFTTPEGLYRFKRLNFGTNATSKILQKKMDEILGNIPNYLAIADDVILFATSFDAMYDRIDKVLNRFLECGITLNKQKCKLFMNKVELFGFVFSEKGIALSETKIESIQNMPPPANISELSSFFGMTNYLSRFLSKYSMRIYLLLKLTKKNFPWLWTHKHYAIFDDLKTELISPKVMSYYDPSLNSLIITDASPVVVLYFYNSHPIVIIVLLRIQVVLYHP